LSHAGVVCRTVTDELARLDRLLEGLTRVLEVPGDDATDGSAEPTWQKLDVLEASMGADALSAMLRRQGMSGSYIDEVLAILARRRGWRVSDLVARSFDPAAA
jgi:hypothetical protein